jgi:YidC/Oxa1 family membrane protein insertase
MDKNTLTGLLLIGAIILGFSYFNAPTEAEIEAAKRRTDSLELVKSKKAETQIEQEVSAATISKATVANQDSVVNPNDSLFVEEQASIYGAFAGSANKEGRKVIVENDVLKLTFNTKGAKLDKVELKGYSTYTGEQLVLIDSTSNFNLNFFTKDNKNIFTDDLVFDIDSENLKVSGSDEKSISFKLDAGADRYIEFVYQIKGDDYLIDYDINLIGMDQVLDTRTGEIALNWDVNAPNQEKSLKSQREVTTIFYKYKGEDVDDLTATSDEKEDYESSIKWVSLKQQFFNSTIIADEFFDKSRAYAETATDEGTEDYVKRMSTSLTIPITGSNIEKFGMSIYLGPNDYDVLGEYEIGLEEIINLGWGIFGWVNMYAVIPVFDFLDGFDMSYGIIILILTILLKLVLMPITYKTYLSGAKMRVLKPEITEINEKHKDDAMKKQQATMALYRQTGVNPLSGCIPMLIQMPILLAMFRFFPASIQLRQESFLWADDLSSYDSIYNFPVGFEIPFYGDHISLFTILMAISLAFYTKMNSSMTMGAAAEGPMAAQMKIMTYLMPVMMLFFFNNYSAGLSYYYFLANVISMGQTLLIRKVFINEDVIRAKIELNKKKPKSQKKSGFQKRLEDMSKQQQAAAKKKRK